MGSAKLEVDGGATGFAEALVQGSPDGLIAVAVDGTIRFWNQGAQAIFGYAAHECVGHSLEELVIPEDRRDEARLAMAEVLDRGVALFETERRRKDGSRVPVDIALRLVRGATGEIQFIAATHKDTTQLRALREECATEAKFRGLLEAAPDAMVIVGPDRRIAIVNSQTERLFGRGREEMLGQPIELLVPEHFRRTQPGRRTAGATRARRKTDSGQNTGPDLHGRRKDGSEFPCEISLSPMETEGGRLVTAAIRDVSARKKVEAKFRALVEAAPDAMVIVGPTGRIFLVNAQTEKLFGYRRQELVGKPADMLLPVRFRNAVDNGSGGHGRGGHFTDAGGRSMGTGHELYGLRHDNTEFPIEMSSSPLHTEDGMLISNAIRDVTERTLLEARMHQANRLKSEFLANMSHELRTPLNAIIGFAELMHYEEVEPGSNEQKEFLFHILTSGRHLLQLVNDILDLSKIEAGKMEFRPEPIDLQNEVHEVVGMLSSIAASKRISVTMSVEDLGEIQLDPARLKQVLYNYLSNALKFTPEGGGVAVRARAETAHTLRLEVEDSGVGIRPNDLHRLFVEFQQLDAASTKRHAGTGLGLALTKRIVDAQGGSVGVQSVPGEGSVFHAILPRRSRLTVHVPTPVKGMAAHDPVMASVMAPVISK